MERAEIVDSRYFMERREGTLPSSISPEFNSAFSQFLVRAMSMPLEQPRIKSANGVELALMEVEEPGDWPNNVKYA